METLMDFQKKIDNGEDLVIDAEFKPKITAKKIQKGRRHLNPNLKYYLRDLIGIYAIGRIVLFALNENNATYTVKEFIVQTIWMGIFTFAQIRCQLDNDASKNSTFALICITGLMALMSGLLILTETV